MDAMYQAMQAQKAAEAKKKAEEQAEKRRRVANEKRVDEASAKGRKHMEADLEAGTAFGKRRLGDGLGRIQADADVKASKDLMRTRAQEGLSDREEAAIKSKGISRLQGSERKARRQLGASLARSGVQGGTAGQMQVELAAQAMQNRRQFETDLIMNDEATKRKAEMDFANFSTKLASFDLQQAAKEKNYVDQWALNSAQLGSNERSAVRAEIASEAARDASKRKKGGTVLCTAMYRQGFISREVWKNDVAAGISLYQNPDTRPGFLLYNQSCRGIAEYATKHRWAAQLLRPFIVPISKHFTDKNLVGTVLFKVLSSIFYYGGKLTETLEKA